MFDCPCYGINNDVIQSPWAKFFTFFLILLRQKKAISPLVPVPVPVVISDEIFIENEWKYLGNSGIDPMWIKTIIKIDKKKTKKNSLELKCETLNES